MYSLVFNFFLMYLNFLIHFALLCSANFSNSFANKIAFSSQRKQLERFDSSITQCCQLGLFQSRFKLFSYNLDVINTHLDVRLF